MSQASAAGIFGAGQRPTRFALTETGNHEVKSLWHPAYGKLNSFFDLYSAISD